MVGNLELRPNCNIYPTDRLGEEMVTVTKENRKELLPWLTGEYRPLTESASRYRTVHSQNKFGFFGSQNNLFWVAVPFYLAFYCYF